jgi:hypothetical protein
MFVVEVGSVLTTALRASATESSMRISFRIEIANCRPDMPEFVKFAEFA